MTILSTDIDLHFRAVSKIVGDWEKETTKEIAYMEAQVKAVQKENDNLRIEFASLKSRDDLLVENHRLRCELEGKRDKPSVSLGDWASYFRRS